MPPDRDVKFLISTLDFFVIFYFNFFPVLVKPKVKNKNIGKKGIKTKIIQLIKSKSF